jgi:hypothetical protein
MERWRETKAHKDYYKKKRDRVKGEKKKKNGETQRYTKRDREIYI